MNNPTPDDYEVEQVKTGFETKVIARYPNLRFVTSVKLPDNGSIHKQIEQTRDDAFGYQNCANCTNDENVNQGEAKRYPCDDCWEKALDAIEQWADERADDLIGEWASSDE